MAYTVEKELENLEAMGVRLTNKSDASFFLMKHADATDSVLAAAKETAAALSGVPIEIETREEPDMSSCIFWARVPAYDSKYDDIFDRLAIEFNQPSLSAFLSWSLKFK